MTRARHYVGVAGWTVPADLAEQFDGGTSHLERYASRFNVVEINSSFYRPHRRSTYERWAASVPSGFRFSVKLPKTITHERRLVNCADLLEHFADEVTGLGEKRGPILVQIPPSLGFDAKIAKQFVIDARASLGDSFVWEPRNARWFTAEADLLLERVKIARVAADPPVMASGSRPGGFLRLAYFRLHGAPRVYWSAYSPDQIRRQADTVRDLAGTVHETWTIFDNTAAGRAQANALSLLENLNGH